MFDGATDDAFETGFGLENEVSLVVDFEAGSLFDFESGIDAYGTTGKQAKASPVSHEEIGSAGNIIKTVFDTINQIDEGGGQRKFLTGGFVERSAP